MSSYEERLLKDLEEGPVYFYGKRVVGKRLNVLNKLVEKGLIELELVNVDSQSSCLKVRPK